MAKKSQHDIYSLLNKWVEDGNAFIEIKSGKRVKRNIIAINHVGGRSFKVDYERGGSRWYSISDILYGGTNFWDSIDDGMGSHYHKKWSVVHDKGPVDYIESLYRNSPLCTKYTK